MRVSANRGTLLGVCSLLCPILALLGCSDGRPTRVPVSGTVMIDGKPLTKGSVRFVPEGARPSAGSLDSQGRFNLTCYDGEDGAVIGRHRVQVSASEIVGAEKVVWHAPTKYADFRTSGIEVEVTQPVDDLVIELTADGRKMPYIEGS